MSQYRFWWDENNIVPIANHGVKLMKRKKSSIMKMPKLPEFKSDAEAAAWFDTHDTTPYMDDMEEADEEFEVIRTNVQTSLNCGPFQSRK